MSTMEITHWQSDLDVRRRQNVLTLCVQVYLDDEDGVEIKALADLLQQVGSGKRSAREVMQILCDRVVHENHLDMIEKLPKVRSKKRALDVG